MKYGKCPTCGFATIYLSGSSPTTVEQSGGDRPDRVSADSPSALIAQQLVDMAYRAIHEHDGTPLDDLPMLMQAFLEEALSGDSPSAQQLNTPGKIGAEKKVK